MALSLEYGARGLVGVLTPQANSTVEPELGLLLGAELGLLTARLGSAAPDLRIRLGDYLDHVETTLGSFAGAPLRAAAFACTGSSYLVEPASERNRVAAVAARLGHPLLTAAEAVGCALDALGARRLGLVSPYPEWLTEACVAHWRRRGHEIVAIARPESPGGFHAIYTLRGAAVLAAMRRLDAGGIDAIVLAGTGMPTLAPVAAFGGPPALSSNMCLAWQIENALGGAAAFESWLAPSAPWRRRLAERYPGALIPA
jgi:maleate cis-trans isomerase